MNFLSRTIAYRYLHLRRASTSARGPRSDTVYHPIPEAASTGGGVSGAIYHGSSPSVSTQRTLNVAIVGEPNAGKSSLLNALIRAPLSAVSGKQNTTRAGILGILTEGRAQILLNDTPGLVAPDDSGRFQRTLVRAAHTAAAGADAVLLVVDIARRLGPPALREMDAMVRAAAAVGAPIIVAANKADLLRGTPLSREQETMVARGRAGGRRAGQATDLLSLKVALLDEWLEAAATRAGMIGAGGFDSMFMWVKAREGRAKPPDMNENASASNTDWPPFRTDAQGKLWLRAPSVYRHARLAPVSTVAAGDDGYGVDVLRAALLRLAPPKPWPFPAGILTDRSDVDTVADAIRGKIFDRLHAEVPYTVRQSTRSWREVVVDAVGRVRDAQPVEGVKDKSNNSGARGGRGAKKDHSLLLPDWANEWETLTGETPLRFAANADPASLSLRRAVVVHQDIQVPSSRVAAMLLANGGAHVAAIAKLAAADASRILGRKVLLQLHVAVVNTSSSPGVRETL
jgi:small GTP-binding protein